MGILISTLAEQFFGPMSAKILMLGVGTAGQTTLLYKLKPEEDGVTTILPTVGFNLEVSKHTQKVGKTTVLYQLKPEEDVVTTILSTVGFNMEVSKHRATVLYKIYYTHWWL
jgi:GTPase SAR1 family protein